MDRRRGEEHASRDPQEVLQEIKHKRSKYWCIMKHTANMRVHVQEAYAAACEKGWKETAKILKEITKEIDELVEIIAIHYMTDEDPIDEEVEKKATTIRRKIQKVGTLIMKMGKYKEVFPVFMELFLATGHANNIEEHILD